MRLCGPVCVHARAEDRLTWGYLCRTVRTLRLTQNRPINKASRDELRTTLYMHCCPRSFRMWCHSVLSYLSLPVPFSTVALPKHSQRGGQSGYFHNDAGKRTLPTHRVFKGTFELPFWGGVGLICLEWLSNLLLGKKKEKTMTWFVHLPLLFVGRTRTATFTLDSFGPLSSMLPPDLAQMNGYI